MAGPAAHDRAEDEARWRTAMTRALEGDADAYHGLLEELYAVVEAYLRRILGDSPWVEDCVQESLAAVHRARHSYDPRRPFRPWLFTVVRHKALDSLRRDAYRSRHEDPDAESEAIAGPGFDRAEHTIDATRLLERLPEPYRGALVLTKVQGHTIGEAAKLAGTSATAMKSRVHRGLRKLASLLEHEEDLA